MNCASDDEKRSNNNEKAQIFERCVHDLPASMQTDQIIKNGHSRESRAEFVVMRFPLVFQQQWKDGQRSYEQDERRKRKRMR